MTSQTQRRLGDYTGLAENYSKYRSGYAPSVRAALLGLLAAPPSQLDAIDVGAGTGIWTRMLAEAGFRSLTAVEPNEDMRTNGMRDSAGTGIVWRVGRAEAIPVADDSVDLATMASSFHWVDFDRGTAEFCRILRPGGWFVALWNTRVIEANPLIAETEAELARLKPDLKKSAFGPASFTEGLTERLVGHPGFDDVLLLEGRHVETQTADRYLGAWRSVNDVRARLGEEKFAEFIDSIEHRLAGVDTIETTYLTRAWASRRSKWNT
jgi:ubiquinone/menaquinone biosynthesis C-methylase UbiE